jgi:predicted nuclease of predicted toxin-antitoxin system
LRLLLDENVDRRLAAALVARGFDVVHAVEAGLAGASDVAVFDWAIAQGRVVVTRDYSDFSHLADVAQRRGRPFPGVLFLSRALRPGDVGATAVGIERYVRGAGALAPGTVGWVVGGEG